MLWEANMSLVLNGISRDGAAWLTTFGQEMEMDGPINSSRYESGYFVFLYLT